MRKWIAAPLLGCLFLNAIPGQPAEPFAFKDGDRVVLIGNTLIEREQRYGYWELALTRAFPDKNITFRNLGWSGDTVWGDAMAGFGTAADGFKHRKEHVLALKPTVIIIGYGGNEAFDGPGGLKKFEKGLNDLLDSLAPAKARIVLISPPPHEKLGPPLPDPAEQNKNLGLYRDALREVATQRKLDFFDLYKEWSQVAPPDNKFPLTDDGIHLSSWGYGVTAGLLPTKAAEKSKEWRIDVGTKERTLETSRTKATWVEGKGVCFRVTDQMVPFPILRTNKSSPPRPIGKGADDEPGTPSVEVVSHALAIQGEMRVLAMRALPKGRHILFIDGKRIVAATEDEWAKGVQLSPFHTGPEFDQAEQLRQAIIEKNRLYFHRWRPQNETYLFGFRKHEQGKNAVEIPQFDPLIAAKEAEIAKLRVPVAHVYEIKPE